ncbi:MAG: uroporphyrinogen decarboxylase [Hydrotalea sp.]|nr:uroporphyrinogen decarboxylase [Hydrotalea sp.]
MTSKKTGAITALLHGEQLSPPPIWLMRQAGRYLPEYRALRERAGSFLNLCFTPDWATTITLQPLQRFDLSAAIIFSDILVVPFGLGMGLSFQENEGPILEKEKLDDIIRRGFDDEVKDIFLKKLSPLLTAIAQTRAALPAGKDIIGFTGAPWTLFCYMVAGRSSPDFADAVNFAKHRPQDFKTIIDMLTQAVICFLQAQKNAGDNNGADVLKIFDSWASLIPQELLPIALYQPHEKIITAMKKIGQDIICFPKGIADLATYQQQTGARAIAIDHHADMAAVQKNLPDKIILQGNLDPALLKIGGDKMAQAVLKQLASMRNKSYIFNLGHGIDKETPIDHVAQLINLVKNNG